MTAAALLRRRRIVERARALARRGRRLPVVVFVEAAEPAVVVDRFIEMDFVAGGAEFRRLLGVEAFEKSRAVRRRRHVHQQVVPALQPAVVARGEVVQRRVFHSEIALPHRAAGVDNRMA